VPLPLGDDAVRHHQRLDLAAQAAYGERHHRRPQLGRAADLAAFVKRHVDLKPVAAHGRRPVGVERLAQRERGAAGFSRP
jgi:hypothetical protein